MGVRVKEFYIPLKDGLYVAVRIEVLNGQILAFAVRLMLESDPDKNIARYDTAHNYPHRDVLGRRKGLLRKDWLEGINLKKALEIAIDDFKNNYERYHQIFEEN